MTTHGSDHPIMVLGSPPSPLPGGPAHLMAEMSTRARKAFYANKKTLCAKTKLASHLKAHNAIVREAELWGAPTWPIHDSLLRNANTIQLQHTRAMIGLNRKPGECWHEWNTRTLRAARVTLHKLEIPWSRFGTFGGTLAEHPTPPRGTSSHGKGCNSGQKNSEMKAQQHGSEACREIQPRPGHRETHRSSGEQHEMVGNSPPQRSKAEQSQGIH